MAAIEPRPEIEKGAHVNENPVPQRPAGDRGQVFFVVSLVLGIAAALAVGASLALGALSLATASTDPQDALNVIFGGIAVAVVVVGANLLGTALGIAGFVFWVISIAAEGWRWRLLAVLPFIALALGGSLAPTILDIVGFFAGR